MQDYLYVSFFLGHDSGREARALLADCDLLEEATKSPMNKHAWIGDTHHSVSLRLCLEDDRLRRLLERLRTDGVSVYTRFDREYSRLELDSADWLVMRTATAGLWGGVDLGQTYSFEHACAMCGAGAEPLAPLLAELSKMGKKDIDHLVYEDHFVVSSRLADAIRASALTGIELKPVKSKRGPVSDRYSWLQIVSELPRMHSSYTGYVTEDPCPSCGRAGHYDSGDAPEVPVYDGFPVDARDFNATWEYFGDWQQVRSPTHRQPVGGGRGVIVSKRARRVFAELRIPRMVWVPVGIQSVRSGLSP